MATENNIGENIKKYRNRQGLSQEDFAKKSGVKYTTLTKIESNVIKKPSVLIMAKLAKALKDFQLKKTRAMPFLWHVLVLSEAVSWA